jgi:hypothetical protein
MHLGYSRIRGVIALALAWPESPALAQEAAAATCVSAYEEGQELRKSGRLISARATLQRCARDDCPDFIRTDCGSWYDEVQSELPTVVFAARSQGRDLTEVQISVGGRVLSSHIDGQVVELDPGSYELRFEARDMRPLKKQFVIARGERNRLVQVELESIAAPVAPEQEPDSPSTPPVQRSLLLPGIFVGVGALGLVSFAGLAAWGRSKETQLDQTCSPNCEASEISAVRNRYLLADVSLGVGVASLSLAAYSYLSRDPAPRARAPHLALVPRVDGADVVYGGRF